MTNIEFLSIQVELQEKVLGRWLPCQVGGKFIAERTHIKTPHKKIRSEVRTYSTGMYHMEHMDYMFLCPQGDTVYTDNRKVRGYSPVQTFTKPLVMRVENMYS